MPISGATVNIKHENNTNLTLMRFILLHLLLSYPITYH